MKIGLSVETYPALVKALSRVESTKSKADKVFRTPVAESVADSAAMALCAAASLLDFVATYGIDAERFFPLAQQCQTYAELKEAIFKHVAESQRS